jgi:hypothetical protein
MSVHRTVAMRVLSSTTHRAAGNREKSRKTRPRRVVVARAIDGDD